MARTELSADEVGSSTRHWRVDRPEEGELLARRGRRRDPRSGRLPAHLRHRQHHRGLPDHPGRRSLVERPPTSDGLEV
jgi:hypothetical protein